MGSGPVRRRATVEPTVPKPRMPTRQRVSRSVGLLPDVWNEFSATLERLYQTGKNRRKNFYPYIYIDGCAKERRRGGHRAQAFARRRSGRGTPWRARERSRRAVICLHSFSASRRSYSACAQSRFSSLSRSSSSEATSSV